MSKPFRSDKRKKELQRLQKQEEKRQRRFGKKQEQDETSKVEPIEAAFVASDTDTTNNQTETPDSDTAKSEG